MSIMKQESLEMDAIVMDRNGSPMKCLQSNMETHQVAASARGTQMVAKIKPFEGLTFAKHDLLEKGIDKEILLECLIAECLLNNPNLEMFESSADALSILHFSNPEGDIFTLLNVMRAWSNKAGTKESQTWCKEYKVVENTCYAVEDYVKDRFAQIRGADPRVADLRFAANIEETDKCLNEIIITEIEENICIYRGHPSLGYMSLQSFKRVVLSQWSVAHFHKENPSRIVTLSDSYEIRLDNQKLCMIINEEQATEIYNRLSPGYVLQHIVNQNSVAPIKLCQNGEKMIKMMRTSWWIKAETVPCSLKAFVEALCPQSTVIFEDNGQDMLVYAPTEYHERIKEVLDKEHAALGDILIQQDAEICYPHRESPLRVLLGPGGLIKDILYPDQFHCVGIIQTGQSPLTKEKVVSELEKFGKIKSVAQYHGEKLALGKWGKVSFEHLGDAEKALQSKLSGSFLLEFAFDNDIEDFNKPEAGVIIDRSKTVSIRVCRRPCASGNVSVKISGEKNYSKVLDTDVTVNNRVVTVKAHTSDYLIMSGCDPIVTQEDVTDAFMNAYQILPEDVQIDRALAFETSSYELEFFCCSLTRIFDKVTDANKVNIQVGQPKPEDIFIYAQVKFKTARIASSALDSIKDKKINEIPLEVMDYEDDVHSVKMTVPDDIHLALQSDIEAVVNKLSKSRDITCDFHQNSPRGKMFILSSRDLGSLEGIVEMLRNVTAPTIYPLSQLKKLFATGVSIFLDYLISTRKCCLRIDRQTPQIEIYAPKSQLRDTRVQLTSFFEETNDEIFDDIFDEIVYHHFDFSDVDAKDNAMFEIAKDQSTNMKNVEILPIKARAKDLFVRGKRKDVKSIEEKYFVDRASDSSVCPECSICYDFIDRPPYRNSYILQKCQQVCCWKCVWGLVELALQSKQFPISCSAGEVLCLWDILNMANTIKVDPRTIVSKAIDPYIGVNVDRWAYCHNFECNGVLRKTPGQPYWVCPTCYSRHCPKCGTYYHLGQCHDYEIKVAFEEWMEASDQRKACRNCNMAIEKISGCNIVHCLFCHREICWACLEHFPSDTECYDHLRNVHGQV